jgi:8-oxo-dGTP diphosphatase
MKIPLGLKKVAVICVLQHEDQFLLLKRAKEPNKDMFTPVGGKLDPFESPLSAATRETWEETGIKVSYWKLGGTLIETSPTKYNWMNYIYIAQIPYQSPPSCNEGTLHWIHFDNLLNIPTPKTDWFIYKYLLENRFFAFSAIFDEHLNMVEMLEERENVRVF